MARRRLGSTLGRRWDHLVRFILDDRPLYSFYFSEALMGFHRAIGSYNGNRAVDLDYPLAFCESMEHALRTRPNGSRFRYVHLSGKFVRQNQEKKLWFMDGPRKIKVPYHTIRMPLRIFLIGTQGLLETKALAFADDHPTVWQTFIVKPGGIVSKNPMSSGLLAIITSMGSVLGEGFSVRIDELAAFMTYLAVDGQGENSITENARLVRRGKELLPSPATAQRDGSSTLAGFGSIDAKI